MKTIIVGIFDRKAQVFISMEPTPNIGVAARAFTSIINTQSDNAIYKWPDDHELYELGEWDTETGECRTRKGGKKLIIAGEAAKQRTN